MNKFPAGLDRRCRVCGIKISANEMNDLEGRTDGTLDDLRYCPEHAPEYLTLCLECCAVYTGNALGVCADCRESASTDLLVVASREGQER